MQMKTEITTPTITLNMHQRTATDDDRTVSNYLLVDGYDVFPKLLTPSQYEREGWDGCPILAHVVVEHPEIMWGSTSDVLRSFREAAEVEAVKLGLWAEIA
jgi:hypothetical protein